MPLCVVIVETNEATIQGSDYHVRAGAEAKSCCLWGFPGDRLQMQGL